MARPLLDVSDDDIQAYASAQQLRWFDDPSNASQRFDRNYLRRTVLPLIRDRWPGVDQTLARSAKWQAEASQLQQQLAASDVRWLQPASGILDCALLARLPLIRQRNALRFAIRCNGLSLPSASRLMAVQELALQQVGRGRVQWQGGVVLRYRDQLHMLAELLSEPACGWSHAVEPDVPVSLPNGLGRLTLHAATPACGALNVRFRAGGERVALANGQHQSLAKWFQEHGVAPWQRSRTPLLFDGDTLIAIGSDPLANWPFTSAASRLAWDREIVS